MTQTPMAITIDKLTKRFKGQTAIDGLTLDVPKGSVFGLLGENGAGKTTTISTLLGLITPDSGKVQVLGLDPVRDGLEVRRRVGYVPEVPNLYDWMSIAEIGWFAAGFHPEGPQATIPYQLRFTELTKGFDLPPTRKIKLLSKGMRAKVSLALALASEPELLILDEPTSGLDVLVRREFLESMVDIAGAGRTVVLSSHQIGEVERVASHVALIHQGKLLLAEPLDELRDRTYLLSITFNTRDHLDGPPPGSPIEIIDADNATRQSRWLVHARDRAAIESLRSIAAIDSMIVDSPNLEEIYIGYMRSRRPAQPGSSLAVHVA